jgi:biotin-(acetyl-CoA carboxylase) ligase
MFASLAFVSEWAMTDRTLIPLVAAVAMRRVIRDRFGFDIDLKWPNDLMIGGNKVGGILVETSGDTVVVGCGVNLWWADPIDGAASLFRQDPGEDRASSLAEGWADSLLALLDVGARAWPRDEYENASVTLGAEVYWDEGNGRAMAIAQDGALVVDQDGVDIELRSGEVHTRNDH